MVRDVRVELTFQVWKTHVLTDIRIPLVGVRELHPIHDNILPHLLRTPIEIGQDGGIRTPDRQPLVARN